MADLATPLDTYRARQRDLSAVERFSQATIATDQRRYHALLPARAPGAGEQYAFRVDLEQCTGCKACVTACHSLNGLDEDESWREVGLLVVDDRQQVITTSCHHCLDPQCLNGCPTLAYEKDPDTCIVRHLDDQCIGCSYCEFMCPYEVPRFNHRLGIVRKCDMCSGRLAAGEPPACVQSCPTSAITITLAETEPDRSAAPLVPGAPASDISQPTTVYVGADRLDGARVPDAGQPVPARAHDPLATMLVATQAAGGATVLAALDSGPVVDDQLSVMLLLAMAIGLGGMAVGSRHLGRPGAMWRSVMGWRHSWLSREAIGFMIWLPALAGAALAAEFGRDSRQLTLMAALAATAAIGCSIAIYVVAARPLWTPLRVTVRFLGTAAGLGALTDVVGRAAGAIRTGEPFEVPAVVVVVGLVGALAKLSEITWLLAGHREAPATTSLAATSTLLRDDLRALTAVQLFAPPAVAVGILGAVALADASVAALSFSAVALAIALGGEVAERRTFFTASVTPSMPRGLR